MSSRLLRSLSFADVVLFFGWVIADMVGRLREN
jgi:hypothetical protein